jgi:hypothetical protein
MTDEPLQDAEDTEEVEVFIYLKDGEIYSILTNGENIIAHVIDEDLEEVDQEISEMNELKRQMAEDLASHYDGVLFELIDTVE